MIAFERTSDLARVWKLIAGDPRVYAASGDDTAPAAETWQPNAHPAIHYLVATDAEGEIGLYTLIPQNAVCWELHTTRVFGRRAAEAHRAIAPWAFQHLACSRVVASIPATNRAAIRAARAAGFVEFGRNPASFLKDGELVDQILLGISRP